MSNMRNSVVVGVSVVVLLSSGNTSYAQTQGFDFRAQVTGCPDETFDTSTEEFTKFLGPPLGTVTARIVLSDQQMATIATAVEPIRWGELSSAFSVVPRGTDTVVATRPENTFRLEVRRGRVFNGFSWTEAYTPITRQANYLHAAVAIIFGFIHDHPAFRALPRSAYGCM